jgi:hypothetical protein
MSLTASHLNELCSPSYIDGIDLASVTELRARREACQRAEMVLSYLRRVLQGQIDLVLAEMEQRRDGGRSDPARLVEELPSILAAPSPAAPEPAHVSVHAMATVSDLDDLEFDVSVHDLLNQLLPDEQGLAPPQDLLPGANLCTFGEGELEAALEWLREEETVLSGRRRTLHEHIDAIQAAIVHRYKSGAAHPDSLLN